MGVFNNICTMEGRVCSKTEKLWLDCDWQGNPRGESRKYTHPTVPTDERPYSSFNDFSTRLDGSAVNDHLRAAGFAVEMHAANVSYAKSIFVVKLDEQANVNPDRRTRFAVYKVHSLDVCRGII